MVKSRLWAMACGLCVGLVVGPISFLALAVVVIGSAHRAPDGGGPAWEPFILPLLPLAVGWGASVAVSARPHRRVAFLTAAATALSTYAAILAATAVLGPRFESLTINNDTGHALVVAWIEEGVERPYGERNLALAPGESSTSRGVAVRSGTGIRVFAENEQGIRVFDRSFTWEEFRELHGAVTIRE